MSETFWDKRAQQFENNIKKQDFPYKKTITKTKSLLTEADVVLDFGCATGEIGLGLASYVQRLQGIDLSAKMIELANDKAQDRQTKNVQFDQVDLFDQRLAAGSFTAVIAFNIFHLVDDLPKTLARLHELLAKGGLLITQTPCLEERGWLFRALIGLAQTLRIAPPIWNLTYTRLETLVARSNFKILESIRWDEASAVQWITASKV